MANRLRLLMAVTMLFPQLILASLNMYATAGNGQVFSPPETATLAMMIILVLLLPGPAWRWLMGSKLAAMRHFCERVKQGDYRKPLILTNEDSAGDEELTVLMRDMNWMARRMEGREMDLQQAVGKLSRSQQLLSEQNQSLEQANAELRDVQRSLQTNNQDLESAYRRMKQMALTDPLTSLANRRCFFETLERQYGISPDGCRPLSMLMIDIDRFKSINDKYGHQTGDWVLQQLAALIRRSTRQTDLTARIGGEEYAVLMPDTMAMPALQVAQRIHEAVNASLWTMENGTSIKVTVSIGVCTLPCFRCRADGELLFHGADLALYHAKNNGRNGISRYDETRSAVEKIA
ncbi:MAG TPA: diguanylate cyclase [Patescibacteria group bacterium]|nr:diguanylate cyclase [Patescibacteria group bacterium]